MKFNFFYAKIKVKINFLGGAVMLDYKLKIGLVPERRYLPGPKRTGIFNPDYAVANKEKLVDYLKKNYTDEKTEFVDIDFLNDEGHSPYE